MKHPPSTKVRVKKYSWREISKAIDKAYDSAPEDSWGVGSYYKYGLKVSLRKSL